MILFNALQKSISAGIGRYSFELSKELYFQLKDDIKIIVREEDIKDYEFVNSKSLIIFKNIKILRIEICLSKYIYLSLFLRNIGVAYYIIRIVCRLYF
ncbi:Putative glycosyltransferase [Candidatus Arthromitus sp. SFB-2]|nr:Putative glycosyltransferase [Candidatus Arthromitus sp. SFB-2]